MLRSGILCTAELQISTPCNSAVVTAIAALTLLGYPTVWATLSMYDMMPPASPLQAPFPLPPLLLLCLLCLQAGSKRKATPTGKAGGLVPSRLVDK